MAFDPHANLAYATVTTAPSPADSGLTLEIINADAAQFPDPATAGAYNCTVWAAQEIPIKSNSEIVRITAKAAAPAPRAATHTQLTITRTQESSLARSIVVGDQLAITITKKVIDDIENNKADKITSGVEDNLVSIDDAENIKDSGLSVIDDDTMAAASATTIATSESTKAYVDNGTWLKDSIFRQAIINGNFDVSQRATTFVAGANNDDVYTLDHWNLISDGNDVFDVSQEAITDLPGSNYAIKLDVETAKRGGIVQFLEAKNAQKFKGKTVSISFAVKSANISALRATVLSWASTADAVTSDVVGTWAATPTWATNWADNATPADLTVTSSWTTVKVEGIVLDEATVNNLALVIWTPNEETIGDIVYITQVQMNEGSKALPFMPKSFEEELRACRAYTYNPFYLDSRTYSVIGLGYGVTTTIGKALMNLPVTMRIQPTLSWSGNFRFDNSIDSAPAATSIVINTAGSGLNFVHLEVGAAFGIQAKVPFKLERNNDTSAVFLLSSEL